MTRTGSAGRSVRRAPLVLAFDSAGAACSVVVARGHAVLADAGRPMRHGHAEALLPMVDAVMRRAAIAAGELDLVATTVGPGGFTGLRTGLAAAQGIAFACGARLVGVTGFEAVAALASAVGDGTAPLLVAIDSRRADLYVQLFDPALKPRGGPEALLPETLASRLAARLDGLPPPLLAGDAAERAGATLRESGAVAIAGLIPGSAPEARGVLYAALNRLPLAAATAGVQPLYLRPPDVTIPGDRRPAAGGRR